MIPHLYRFRPIGAVLDKYEELAKQEIYFSPPDELNDHVGAGAIGVLAKPSA
jgi:hypothetical protein